MEYFICIVLGLLKVVIIFLHLFLLLRHSKLIALLNLLNSERTFYDTEHISRDNVLNLERQILLYEIVSRAYDTEIIICGKLDSFQLLE